MLSAILLAAMTATGAPSGSDTTFAVPAGGRLEVSAATGSVTVRVWNRNEMRVSATRGERSDVAIRIRGNVVYIEGAPPGARRAGRAADVQLQVTLPASYAVSMQGLGLSGDITGLNGNVNFQSMNGSIRVRDVSGEVRAESMSGGVDVDNVRGNVHARSTNSTITLARVNGGVDAETVNGSIALRELASATVAANTVNGQIRFSGRIVDGGRYSFGSHNGDIVLTVAERTNATFYVATYNGSLNAGFPVQLQPGGSDRRFSFLVGSGSARVEVETFNGNLRVARP